ncbi:Rieske 2Fe-2S domain-containing protein [Ilumatobacter sp.]|uniref:Rieske 2Fe-2S domain-containing protein n=1 Tax=Ilumatobacter sp. TaxID=1967498 RepID=UPI003C574E8D
MATRLNVTSEPCNRVDNETPALGASWHAVLTSDELGDEPVRVELLGEPWMLARLDGDVVAFHDRCPHRNAPLSIGTICGTQLQCAYHGWMFDADGACTEIPSLGPDATIPSRAAARRAGGVAEAYGLVWISPETPLFDLPAFDEWDDDSFDNARNEPRETPASVGQLIDNFLDATHLRTVHAGTFGVDDGGYLPPSEIVRDGWSAHTTFEVQYKNFDDPLVETGEHPLVQPQRLYKEIAGPTTAVVRLYHPMTDKTVSFLFACSPTNNDSTRVFKLMSRNDLTDPAAQLPALLDFEDRVLDEDLVVLEAYDDMAVNTELRDEVSVRSDRLSVAYRRILAELVAHRSSRETALDSTMAPAS